MHEAHGHTHVLGQGARSRESNLVVDRAEIAHVANARLADAAGNDSFDDHQSSRGANVQNVAFESTDPLVPEDEGVSNVREINRSVNQLQIGAADPSE
jgi:hypothetical protein